MDTYNCFDLKVKTLFFYNFLCANFIFGLHFETTEQLDVTSIFHFNSELLFQTYVCSAAIFKQIPE